MKNLAGYNVSQLNQIVKDTIRLIEKSKEAIYDIAEGARNEYAILESELNKLQLQTEELIKRSDELELALKISRKELAYYSKILINIISKIFMMLMIELIILE